MENKHTYRRPVEITRERADEIIRDHLHGTRQQVVICYGGKWYDIRNLRPWEIERFITELFGRRIKPEERAHVEIRL